MFDSTKTDLKEILESVHAGVIQLPDFQRDYVWDDDDVRSLIASIAKGYPVGALLTLEAGSEVAFKPRLLAGVPDANTKHKVLLLDGQQRITSLYQVMYSALPVTTKTRRGKKTVQRYYYLDITKAVSEEADILDAIVAVPEDKVLRSNFGKDVERDLSSSEQEYASGMFPLNKIFDSKDWLYGWRDFARARQEDIYELERGFDKRVIDTISRYKMPIIALDNSNSREAICLVFEKVNVGGKKLDAFELLTAIYAADNFDLREAWSGAGKNNPGLKQNLVGPDKRRRVLRRIESTDYLQACTLIHTRAVRLDKAAQGAQGMDLPQILGNRQAMLGLPLSAFRKYSPAVEKGFIEAASFLNELKIISARDVPYPSQVVALATIFAILGNAAQNAVAKQKLRRWFWCGALGELYGSGAETLIARDVPAVVDWIASDGPLPPAIEDAIFRENRLRNLRHRVSAAYKAIHTLLMSYGCKDFVSGEPVEIATFFDKEIDIHHIFPRAWCKKNGVNERICDSIVNKTPLSKRSNQRIGGTAPSSYLERIEDKDKLPLETIVEILRGHLIDPNHLRADDFEAFYRARMRAICDLITEAMGKPTVPANVSDDYDDLEDDEVDELEEDFND